MTELDILNTLNSQMVAFVTAHPNNVVYPNTDYDPVLGTPFLDVHFLPGDIIQASIGTESKNRSVGIYQIDIYTPKSQGTYASKEIVDDLFPFFNRGTVITNGSNTLRITSFKIGRANNEDAWYRQMIEIAYRSDIDNT